MQQILVGVDAVKEHKAVPMTRKQSGIDFEEFFWGLGPSEKMPLAVVSSTSLFSEFLAPETDQYYPACPKISSTNAWLPSPSFYQ